MFWDNFYNACQKKGIKPTPLVEELNISKGSITSWKNGGIPNGEALVKISEYLDVSIDYLLKGNEKLNIGCNSTFHNNGTVAISENQKLNFSEDTPAQVNDEMTTELIKRFSNLSFDEKLNVFDYIKNIKD